MSMRVACQRYPCLQPISERNQPPCQNARDIRKGTGVGVSRRTQTRYFARTAKLAKFVFTAQTVSGTSNQRRTPQGTTQ